MNNVASPAISIPHQHRFPSVEKKPHTACFISAELVLADSGLPIISANNMSDAAQKGVAAAAGKK